MPLLLQITVSFNGAHIQVDFPSSSPSLPPYLEEQLANSIEEVLTEWAFALPVIDAEHAENLTGGEDVLQELEAQDGMAVEVDLAVQTLPANREDRYMLVRENLQWTKNCPLGFRHVDASTEPEGGYYSLCHQCLNATYGDTAAAVLMQWLNSEAQLTFDSECGRQILRTLGQNWKEAISLHQHQLSPVEQLLDDPACQPLCRRLIADLHGVAAANPNILQERRMLMKRGVQDLPEYKKAMLSTRIRPYLLVPTLRMARYSLFTAAVAEAAGLTNAADVSVDLRLLANQRSRDHPRNESLDRLITSVRRLQQADGVEATRSALLESIPQQWLGVQSSPEPMGKQMHQNIQQALDNFIMPALQCLLGPDLVTLPYKTAPSHNADHHEYPQWFQFFNKGKEATFVAKTETGGQKEQRWEAMTLPEISTIIENVAVDVATAPPHIFPLLRQALASSTYKTRPSTMFDFTDLLDRFTWLKEFLIIFDTVITTETCDQVMKVMTTAVMATTVVQHTSVIWLWGHYELEKLLQELGCKATSSNETLQQQAEIFEQLGTLLEALLIYAVVGSTMGLKTVHGHKSDSVNSYLTFAYEHQQYRCGFATCSEPLEGDVGGASRLRTEASTSTCQYSARVGNRRLVDQVGGWDAHVYHFPCLADLWHYTFHTGIASHALISVFQGHFIDKASRGKTTRWMGLARMGKQASMDSS